MAKQTLSVKAVFDRALEIESAVERKAYLDEACAAAPELRQPVEALLKAYEEAGSFLQKPAPDLGATVDSQPGDDAVAALAGTKSAGSHFANDGPGRVIGPYKLLQQIGEGGMGTVFMAEQTHPVQRMVALKIIKDGMDSRQVIARFEAERQALALMDHPNIARVLDAGTTDAGRPYFVMELVKGVPITRYCDDHHLTLKQRLELFLPVCQAVQHAHQKGIIHRDIKPSNVMVCLYDNKPVPKVIDFGVAKATGQKLTEHTLFTEFGTVVGTLEYMSPEQAGLNQMDIDTRSDIYSLGVLLYELLTGTTPLERKRLKESALLELLRLIREEEPPKPSTRLSTTEGLPSIAANRGLEPKKLSGLMRGELDWIVMKALEKDRSRRYETANGFAADVQRHLADEPVQACPPSSAYRLRKFVRRNRGPMLAAILVLLALVGGIIGTTLGLLQARVSEAESYNAAIKAGQERDRANDARDEERKAKVAERQAKEAESFHRKLAEAARDRAADTLDDMTSGVVGAALSQQQIITPEQKVFLTTVLKYYRELLDDKASDEAARKRLAAVASRVGAIEVRLGRNEEGETMFRQARDLYAKLTTEFPAVAEYRLKLAHSHGELAGALRSMGKWKQAELEYRAAVVHEKKLVNEFADVPEYRRALATSRNNLGLILLVNLEELNEGEVELRAATELRAQLAREFPTDPKYRRDLCASHHNLGSLWQKLRKPDQAEKEYRAAIVIRQKLVDELPAIWHFRHLLGQSHINLGNLLAATKKPKQAETEFRAAIDICQQLVTEFPIIPIYRRDLAASHNLLGSVLEPLGKLDEAGAQYRAARDIGKQLMVDFPAMPVYHHQLAVSHISLGVVLDGLGKRTQAEAEFRAAIAVGKKLAADFPAVEDYRRDLAKSHYNLGYNLRALKQGGMEKRMQAEAEFRAAIAIGKKLVADFPAVRVACREDLASSHFQLGDLLYAGFGKLAEAETQYRAALAIQKKLADEFPAWPTYRHHLSNTHSNLGMLLQNLKKLNQAETEYRVALDIHQKLVQELAAIPEYRLGLAQSHGRLGMVLEILGKREQAERELRASLDVQQKLAADYPAIPDYALSLGGSLCNLAHVLKNDGRRKEALVLFDQAIQALTPLVQKEPTNNSARQFLLNSYNGRATTLDQVKRYQEAAQDWASALNLASLNAKTSFHRRLMLSRALDGQFEAALKDADQLAKSESKDLVYDCASVYGLAHAKTADEKQAIRAVELLRQAVARGFRDADHMRKDTDLDSLRARADFKKLLAELDSSKK